MRPTIVMVLPKNVSVGPSAPRYHTHPTPLPQGIGALELQLARSSDL